MQKDVSRKEMKDYPEVRHIWFEKPSSHRKMTNIPTTWMRKRTNSQMKQIKGIFSINIYKLYLPGARKWRGKIAKSNTLLFRCLYFPLCIENYKDNFGSDIITTSNLTIIRMYEALQYSVFHHYLFLDHYIYLFIKWLQLSIKFSTIWDRNFT